MTLKGEDGLTRYYSGSFSDVNKAAAYKVRMLINGFDGAFLVAFREGKRVSMRGPTESSGAPRTLRTLPMSGSRREGLSLPRASGHLGGRHPVNRSPWTN